MRTIVLHYHLFKNAGTSLDRILQQNFGAHWVTAEFSGANNNNTRDVTDWIVNTPEAVAFSSHTMVGPLPQLAGVRIVPVVLLRDPVARIRSAYQFERKQVSDSWGAQLAKEHDLEGYVVTRLNRPNDRQCRNFQTARLATLVPGPQPELDRALRGLEQVAKIGVVGLVEDFNGSLTRLAGRLQDAFPDFVGQEVRANVSTREKQGLPAALSMLLEENNRDDTALLQAATQTLHT